MRFGEAVTKYKELILALAILFLGFAILFAGNEIADAIVHFAELYVRK